MDDGSPLCQHRDIMALHADTIIQQIRADLDSIPDHQPANFTVQIPASKFEPTIGIDIANAFIRPANANAGTEELRAVAFTEEGQRKRLSPEQLRQIRERAEFSVDSRYAPGQKHVWSLAHLLQKGTFHINDDYLTGLSRGLRSWMNAGDRIAGKHYSVRSGFRHLGESIKKTTDLLVGLSHTDRVHSDSTINKMIEEERIQHMVESNIMTVDEFAVLESVFRPNGTTMNTLKRGYERLILQWANERTERRERIANELAVFSIDRILETEAELLEQQTLDMIAEKFSQDVGAILTAHLKVESLIRRKLCDLETARTVARATEEARIKDKYPVRGRVPGWLNARLEKYMKKWNEQNSVDTVLKTVLESIPTDNVYLRVFRADLSYILSPAYTRRLDELRSQTKASTTFDWRYVIYRPKNWHIKNKATEENPHYSLKRTDKYTTTTAYPGWRIRNLLMRTSQAINNGAYGLAVWALYGPVGLRSLVGMDVFYPDYCVDTQTGELVKDMKFSVRPWFGKIRALWKSIGDAIAKFEATPDTTFFGKDFARILNRIYNYGIRGILGTVGIAIGHPLLVLLSTIASAVGIITSPLWAPLYAILVYIFNALIYDHQSQDRGVMEWFPLIQSSAKFVVKGLGQLVTMPFAAIFECICGGVRIGWETACFSTRHVYDALVYHFIIKHRARIPMQDSFLARRVSGPGIAVEYFYQIQPEIAILFGQKELERILVQFYTESVRQQIDVPLDTLRAYMNTYKQVGFYVDSGAGKFSRFEATNRNLREKLNTAVDNHWKSHAFQPSTNVSSSKIRMTRSDLTHTIDQLALLAEEYYNDAFLKTDPHGVQWNKYWNDHTINPGNWRAIAESCLRRGLGDSIMQTVEELDETGVRLLVKQVNLISEYAHILKQGSSEEVPVTVSYNAVKLNDLDAKSRCIVIPTDLKLRCDTGNKYIMRYVEWSKRLANEGESENNQTYGTF